MASNFLGEVGGVGSARAKSGIISATELIAREGVNLQKGMNFRDKGPLLSVFLVLPREDGFRDEWDAEADTYLYEGHDSTTVEGGKSLDQLLMYPSGKLTDNGKFWKAAKAFCDGVRKEPMQVQVYEKLDPGVWFDKGIFNLVDAKEAREDGRKVYKFLLQLAGAAGAGGMPPDEQEVMISATEKVSAWESGHGRCAECRVESGLHFIKRGGRILLLCAEHSGRGRGGLL